MKHAPPPLLYGAHTKAPHPLVESHSVSHAVKSPTEKLCVAKAPAPFVLASQYSVYVTPLASVIRVSFWHTASAAEEEEAGAELELDVPFDTEAETDVELDAVDEVGVDEGTDELLADVSVLCKRPATPPALPGLKASGPDSKKQLPPPFTRGTHVHPAQPVLASQAGIH